MRPYCHTDHYWQVFFDTNKAILATGADASWPIPVPQQVIRQTAQTDPRPA